MCPLWLVAEPSISESCLPSLMKLNSIPGSTPCCILNEIQFTSLVCSGYLSRINNVPRHKLQFARFHYFPICSWQIFAVMRLAAIDFLIKVQVNQWFSNNFKHYVEMLLREDF